MSFALGVVIFIVAVLISITLHELGHFLTAKKFGMKVTQFFIGFGNTLWSTRVGETQEPLPHPEARPDGHAQRQLARDEPEVADGPRQGELRPGPLD